MGSYTSLPTNLNQFVHELVSLYRLHQDEIPQRVARLIEEAQLVEARIREAYDIDIKNMNMLEIGPGPFLTQLLYFAKENRVVGIDLDILPRELNPFAYFNMLQVNGVRRTLKTIGRKICGIDLRHARELRKQLQVKRLPYVKVLQMDIGRMVFPDNSFDFVYTRALFHHLPDPITAVKECCRVLRSGGICYITLHLFTSPTGCLDPRIYKSTLQDDYDLWPHLRPTLEARVCANAQLNKLRLEEWRSIFNEAIPGSKLILRGTDDSQQLESAARQLQDGGELRDYSLQELLTYEVAILWRKP